eukprot:CAMPEP_0181246382 /NCGR_PEP_ID=MMETSP1096-20121128/43971_1 /TAXON_ID=156174 ORGANISM="Chrysochromulina ericina, Strain CCMP281" /NCGR_SAMPLE_ID=MMETSP1096 /ASSEMBLY_ACC=CAM_ASM_000453 /LENGTH=69 /DNA_ID=CAMNT_0023343209 /DNA_START=366 /DNA_END=572 /DNA_ORIENTATION=+
MGKQWKRSARRVFGGDSVVTGSYVAVTSRASSGVRDCPSMRCALEDVSAVSSVSAKRLGKSRSRGYLIG